MADFWNGARRWAEGGKFLDPKSGPTYERNQEEGRKAKAEAEERRLRLTAQSQQDRLAQEQALLDLEDEVSGVGNTHPRFYDFAPRHGP